MYSTLSKKINPFTVLQLVHRASEFEKQGHRVVHFEIGEPDFQTAEPIVAKAESAIKKGLTKYTSAQGISNLRVAISNFYKQQGVEVPSDRIIITGGASGVNRLSQVLSASRNFPRQSKDQPTCSELKAAWMP